MCLWDTESSYGTHNHVNEQGQCLVISVIICRGTSWLFLEESRKSSKKKDYLSWILQDKQEFSSHRDRIEDFRQKGKLVQRYERAWHDQGLVEDCEEKGLEQRLFWLVGSGCKVLYAIWTLSSGQREIRITVICKVIVVSWPHYRRFQKWTKIKRNQVLYRTV